MGGRSMRAQARSMRAQATAAILSHSQLRLQQPRSHDGSMRAMAQLSHSQLSHSQLSPSRQPGHCPGAHRSSRAISDNQHALTAPRGQLLKIA